VILLDSVGELAAVYALADVAFVGGSLVARGGHNILEPAYFGKAIIVGPHNENFRDIVGLFRRAGALVEADQTSFATDLVALCESPERRAELGGRAAALVRSQQGATDRTLEMLSQLFASHAELAIKGGAR
jgi:3-deoxy-D-manno-octulosonic-acid transferase